MNFNDLSTLFFKELKQYNSTNFKTLQSLDLESNEDNPILHKACSSVVTRYFIFSEKHPEISDQDKKILYFQLHVDLIAQYFAKYPTSSIQNLQPFQDELRNFVNKCNKAEEEKTAMVG